MKELRKARAIVEFRPSNKSNDESKIYSLNIEFMYEHNPYDLSNDFKKQSHDFWNSLTESQKWAMIDSSAVPKNGILKLLAVK